MSCFYNKKSNLGNKFILPNQIMQIGLSPTALAVYCYLLYIEDRKTYQCYPSYKTIGKALDITVNTVSKYVKELEAKRLIYTEYTEVILKNGKKQNGNLLYTIRPIHDAVDYYLSRKMDKLDQDTA